ncbi:MAG: hypothetical protein Harvfovirus2_4 [Harvfovirus sp.]|uniref:Uncharacterized protein n=1 Tax=Harvfovirus sp. TaxID=2487768 RepID=A0A3G5A1U4_9VIRU|nr:MAG: hypothetical protein Harvfovirus2_4 [Harvfovirus sp.]
MTQIRLEGFELFTSRSQKYFLPRYSYTCSCGIKVYLVEYLTNNLSKVIFEPKFLKKYRKLVNDGNSFDPYTKIITQNSMCELHPIEIGSEWDYNYRPGRFYNNFFSSSEMEKFYLSLLESNYFLHGPWLGRFAYDYWAKCQYDYFGDFNTNSTVEQKKINISRAVETKLLNMLQIDIDRLVNEIYKGFEFSNMISPLIGVICEYNCPAFQMMGKIIAQFKADIEKYME